MKKAEKLSEEKKSKERRLKGETWYELDNAANLFPAISNDRNTNVFRISCELRENIDKAVLQEALNKAIRGFEFFRVVLHRGLFWYYLEETDLEPKVRLESQRPCERIFYTNVKELLFHFSYFGNRINIEAFHVLADGSGAADFLRSVVYHYIVLQHRDELPAILPDLDKAPPSHMAEDSFRQHYDPKDTQSPFRNKAYTISGTALPSNSVKIISARMSTKQILGLSKSKGVTVTAYLCSLMICSIYSGLVPKRASNRTIAVNVPVDLRGHFSSESARNFFGVVEVGYNFEGGQPDFDAVLSSVSEQLSQRVTKDALSRRMNYTMSVQSNIFTGIIPLFLKNIILRLVYHRAESATTCALSNIGRITMPEAFLPYIDSFHCLLNPTPLHRIKACVTSFQDQFIINFTSCIEETKAQRNFLRHLAQAGIDITITGNGGADDEAV